MPAIDLGLIITGTNRASGPLRQAGSQLDDLGRSVKRVGDNSQATANRLKAIEVVIGGILINKALELTKAFVAMAAANENNDARLAAWVGGLDKANAMMAKLNASVGSAGVELDNMGDAMVKLRAAGVSSEDALRTVENLVKGIASVGGGDLDSKLAGAATAFQRFSAKGIVSTRELNAIINSTGLSVSELAAASGVSITRFYENLKDKTTGSQQLLDAFNRAAQEKFGDFASLLDNTIAGSISKFKNNIDEAFGNAGMATGVNTQLVAFIQNLDRVVTDFISTISKDDIEKFFGYFRDAAPTLANVGQLILMVGKAMIVVSNAAFRFASMLPNEAVQFGILGYVLMGKKGALLLGLVGALTGQLKTLAGQVSSIASSYDNVAEKSGKGYQGVLDALNKKDPKSPFINMLTAATGATISWANSLDQKLAPALAKLAGDAKGLFGDLGTGSKSPDWISKLLGSPEQLKAIEDAFAKLATKRLGTTGLSDPPENTDLMNSLAQLRQETENLMERMSGQDALLRAQTAGDELAQKIQQITNQTDQWNNSLETAAVKIATSKLPLEEKVRYTQQLGALQERINTSADQAIAQARVLNGLKQQQLDFELQIEKAGIAEQSRQLAMMTRANGDSRFAAMSGTSGGRMVLAIDEQRIEYAQKILEYQTQIAALEVKATTDTANAAQYKQVEDQLRGLIAQTTTFAENLNATTQLQTQFFGELGRQMEDNIAGGLSALIQGTATWGDVGRQVFGDMIQMSIKYLIQLATIRMMESTLGAMGGGGGIGGLLGMALGFKDGGIPGVDGGKLVTPFANGGLTTGPTLFGLAGEAGQEAIMPVTRVGGKLGVNASGTGGNSYHITVNAVDTQTGMQFIAKNIAGIEAGLKHRNKLNKSN